MQFRGPSPACHGSTASVTQLWAWPPGLPKDRPRGAWPPCGEAQGQPPRSVGDAGRRESVGLALLTQPLTLKALVHSRSSSGSLTPRGGQSVCSELWSSSQVQKEHPESGNQGSRPPSEGPRDSRSGGSALRQSRGKALGGPQPVTHCVSASDCFMTFF